MTQPTEHKAGLSSEDPTATSLLTWLWPVLGVVLIGIALLTVNGYRVSIKLDEAQSAQTDNNTWLVTQLEVEVLKLMSAVRAAREPAAAPADYRRLRRAFDIYLSRLNVISGHLAQPGPLQPQRDNDDWRHVLRLTQEIELMMALPDPALQTALASVGDELAGMRHSARQFAVSSLALLVESNAAERVQLRGLLTRFAVVALLLIVLLVGTSVLMLRLSVQLRLRGRRAERMRSNLEKTLAAALDGVIVATSDGRILQVNAAAEAIFGHDRETLLAQDIRSVLLTDGPEPDEAPQIRRFLEGGLQGEPPPGRGVMFARGRDGRRFPAEVVLAADRDMDGRPVVFAFIRDISDQRQFETSLRNARDAALSAAEAKSRFLAVMSHEMRTPLNGMIAALELMQRTTPLDARQARFVEIAGSGAQTALEQINAVLELARLDRLAPEPEVTGFNLARTIHEVADQLAPLARRNGNHISLDLPAACAVDVTGPRRIFVNTLVNLVGNAVKFTHGGQIDIRARLAPAPDSGLLLRIEVEDTGIGIAPDKLDRIFEPFETLDNGYDRATEGTGLGLGIARRAAELMGGAIGVESCPGVGSVFWFTARMQPGSPALAAEAVALPQRALPPAPRDILIAEDNPTNRLVLREMLEHLGQRVTEAETGAEAVELARARNFDLILMDISMPVLDGLAASRAIRAAGASRFSRIVGVTAHGLPEELQRFAAAGLPEVIRKPITFPALTDLLQTPVVACQSEIDESALLDLRRILPPASRAQAVAGLLAEGAAFIAALDQPDIPPDELGQMAHRLHGAAAQFGGISLARGLQQLELRLAAGQDRGGPALRLGLVAEWRSLAAMVRRILAD